MQSVVSLDTTDIYTDNKNKRPSAKLQEKIKTCVSMFRSLNETVNEVIALGQKEGFTPKEIGQFIRQEMIKAGLSRMTITRYLPAELKAKPRGFQVSNKMLQTPSTATVTATQSQTNKKGEFSNKMLQMKTQTQPLLTDDIDIEVFSVAATHLKPEILGKVIDHLAQIYNEKTGQKIVVIFRKMIDGDGTTKDKKYQPTPDEIKQREQKIMSLVEEGILRIANLVEQSGVSESATRRYLQKAGYKIMAGTISS